MAFRSSTPSALHDSNTRKTANMSLLLGIALGVTFSLVVAALHGVGSVVTPTAITMKTPSATSSAAAAAAAAAAAQASPVSAPAIRHQKLETDVVILVTTKATASQRRAWQRNQYRKSMALLPTSQQHRAVFRFVVGTHRTDSTTLASMEQENSAHEDILMLPVLDADNPDPPPEGRDSATTLKVMHATKWFVDNYNFKYLARVGDDAYFRVDYFLSSAVLPKLPPSRLYLGWCVLVLDLPAGYKNIAVPRVPYCAGMGFVLSIDAAQYVAGNIAFLRKGFPEDAVVGSWFVGTNVMYVHDERFHDAPGTGGVRNESCGDTHNSILLHRLRTEADWKRIDQYGNYTC